MNIHSHAPVKGSTREKVALHEVQDTFHEVKTGAGHLARRDDGLHRRNDSTTEDLPTRLRD